MQISLVVAMSENRVIGQAGQLPWRLSKDLQHFKALTMGKPIVMGRITFESIKKPLPGRTNIILTSDESFHAPGCIVLHSKEAVLKYCQNEPEIMIVGGARVYDLFLPQVQSIYLTIVHTEIKGDAFFPQLDMQAWEEINREAHYQDDKNEYDMSFITLERKG